MQIGVDETRCSGCRACELACVARHEQRFGTATARIRVRKLEADGIDRPFVCDQCAEAHCIASCPVGVLARKPFAPDTERSVIAVHADDCIACSACADACASGGLFLHAESGVPLICDLCDGDPECVKRCVTGALTWVEEAPSPAHRGGDRV